MATIPAPDGHVTPNGAGRPPLAGALIEPVRAGGEYVTSVALRPFLPFLPEGDGHPVLLLPGFMASDGSTAPLRRFLEGLGYRPQGWQLGRNIGPTPRVLEVMPRMLAEAAEQHGPVSIVGWSLGGIYARHLAATQAKAIRTIVTLGAPVRSAVEQTSHAHSVYTALRRLHADHSFALDEGSPLAVPVTAIHTRTDAIVHWRTCLVDPAPNAENLRVRGSHVGLGFNPAVMYIIADRLSQAPGRWAPFHAPLPYRRIITRVSVA